MYYTKLIANDAKSLLIIRTFKRISIHVEIQFIQRDFLPI